MKLAFMGTPEFSRHILQRLSQEHEIICVYSQPPRRQSRGMHQQPCPVHQWALDQGICVRTPINFKDPEEQEHFNQLPIQAAIVVAYGLLLPTGILNTPAHGCLNLHASLLPRWRGASPIERAIQYGDKETGLCVIKMDQQLDHGPILSRQIIPINPEDTAQSMYEKMAPMGANLLCQTLAQLPHITPQAQSKENISYAPKIHKNDRKLNFQLSADDILRQIRAFSGVFFEHKGQRLTILDACVVNQSNPQAGHILDDHMTISCGQKAIRPLIIQKSGKKPLKREDFQNGNREFVKGLYLYKS